VQSPGTLNATEESRTYFNPISRREVRGCGHANVQGAVLLTQTLTDLLRLFMNTVGDLRRDWPTFGYAFGDDLSVSGAGIFAGVLAPYGSAGRFESARFQMVSTCPVPALELNSVGLSLPSGAKQTFCLSGSNS